MSSLVDLAEPLTKKNDTNNPNSNCIGKGIKQHFNQLNCS